MVTIKPVFDFFRLRVLIVDIRLRIFNEHNKLRVGGKFLPDME